MLSGMGKESVVGQCAVRGACAAAFARRVEGAWIAHTLWMLKNRHDEMISIDPS
jgi:hypothetical protein